MKNRVVEIDDNVVALEIIYKGIQVGILMELRLKFKLIRLGSKYGFIILYLRNLILKML